MSVVSIDRRAIQEVKDIVYRAAFRDAVAQRYGLGAEVSDRVWADLDLEAVWRRAAGDRSRFVELADAECDRLLATHPAVYWWPWSEVPAWQ